MNKGIERRIAYVKSWYRHYDDSRRNKHLPTAKPEPTVCLNCGAEFVGAFCPRCGQSAKTRRFSTKETIIHIVMMLTKFDSTFWRTIVDLFTRPGYMVRDYLDGRRMGYMRPLQMLLCLITAYLIIRGLLFDEVAKRQLFGVDNVPLFKQMLKDETAMFIYQHVNAFMQNMIARTLSNIFILSLTCFFCFKITKEGKKINYAEHFYTLIFMNCQIVILLFLMLGYHLINGTLPTDSVSVLVEFFLGVVMYSQLMSMGVRKALRIFILSYLLYVIILIISLFVLVISFLGILGFDNVVNIVQ